MSNSPFNPYQSSVQTYSQPHRRPAPGHVMAPAIALIVVGVVNMLFTLNGFVRNMTGQNDNGPPPAKLNELPPAFQQLYKDLKPHEKTINISFGLLGFLSNGVIISGGVQMARLRMYPLAMTGSILAAVPCLSFLGCCGIGEGVAIWSIIVLMSGDVRSLFR
jgi:hypothetical protein